MRIGLVWSEFNFQENRAFYCDVMSQPKRRERHLKREHQRGNMRLDMRWRGLMEL
jgi:hypothetical protein